MASSLSLPILFFCPFPHYLRSYLNHLIHFISPVTLPHFPLTLFIYLKNVKATVLFSNDHGSPLLMYSLLSTSHVAGELNIVKKETCLDALGQVDKTKSWRGLGRRGPYGVVRRGRSVCRILQMCLSQFD